MALTPVARCFSLLRLSGGDDPNDAVAYSEAVAHDKDAEPTAHTQHDESILVLRVVRVVEPDGIFIEEYGLRLLECNAVLLDVLPILGFVPLEA